MASDLPRFRHRFVSASLAGVLTCSLTWPAHATVVFAQPPDEPVPDSGVEPELSEPELSEPELSDPEPSEPVPPASAPPAPAPPAPQPTSSVTVGPHTDYEAFASSLPQDFDINYQFVRAPDPKKDKPARGMTDQQKKSLRTAGGVTMGLGMFGGAAMLATGAPLVVKAKKDLSRLDNTSYYSGDLQLQQKYIEDGKLGNTLLIAGGATAGGAFVLGLSLLLAGHQKRSVDSQQARPGGARLATKTMRGLSLGFIGVGALSLGLGLAFHLTGDKSPPTALYAFGGASVGLGALFGVLYLVGKGQKRQTARVQLAPMLTRTTSGASVHLRF